ncbi:MAG: tautomerase family protein [Pseudomonas sp.]|uniref:tautomerase family protein n=1 Tax=Pseudomonas sp. TaxID=306 RepID=UPI003D6DEDB2
MPIVRIEDPIDRPQRMRHEIIETVYRCIKKIFGVSDQELQARYIHYSETDFRAPGDQSEYLQVNITLFRGRTLKAKRNLYGELSTSLAELLSIAPSSVLIILDEHDAKNWGMRGGVPANEIDFGYSINI